MAGPITEQHPVEACYGSQLHCSSHEVDEPVADPYRVCFECRHAFASAAGLLAAHNAVLANLNEEVNPDGDPLWEITEPIPAETDPAKVFCCPHCSHDF